MAEKETSSVNTYEKTADVEQYGEIAHERHEAIRDALDREERKHKEHHSEREIVAKAQELANKAEQDAKSHETIDSPARRRSGPINKKQLQTSFNSQMKTAESEMSGSERAFSKLIHNKAIERTTDTVGSTIARPNAMLAGSIFAFIGVGVLYFTAKYYGFQLSGFETIGTFILGWIVGLIYDYTAVLVRGHRR